MIAYLLYCICTTNNALTNVQTIISLALILKHPAPELPVSGSHVSSLANAPTTTTGGMGSNGLQWDLDLYSQTSTDNKLRGSVLSQGTLVVCPVSLVGQWIEGAPRDTFLSLAQFLFLTYCYSYDFQKRKVSFPILAFCTHTMEAIEFEMRRSSPRMLLLSQPIRC